MKVFFFCFSFSFLSTLPSPPPLTRSFFLQDFCSFFLDCCSFTKVLFQTPTHPLTRSFFSGFLFLFLDYCLLSKVFVSFLEFRLHKSFVSKPYQSPPLCYFFQDFCSFSKLLFLSKVLLALKIFVCIKVLLHTPTLRPSSSWISSCARAYYIFLFLNIFN